MQKILPTSVTYFFASTSGLYSMTRSRLLHESSALTYNRHPDGQLPKNLNVPVSWARKYPVALFPWSPLPSTPNRLKDDTGTDLDGLSGNDRVERRSLIVEPVTPSYSSTTNAERSKEKVEKFSTLPRKVL